MARKKEKGRNQQITRASLSKTEMLRLQNLGDVCAAEGKSLLNPNWSQETEDFNKVHVPHLPPAG